MKRFLEGAGAALAFIVASAVQPAQATVLLEGSFANNIPFGPFSQSQTVIITATVTNISPDQTITICEGICLGDANTYSLGGLASIPNGYSFVWGDGGDASLGFLDGQIAGPLDPGQTKDFIFEELTPGPSIVPGWYPFFAQLQIFAATTDRPMLASPSFGGNFQVVPEPATLALLIAGLVGLWAVRSRRVTGVCNDALGLRRSRSNA